MSSEYKQLTGSMGSAGSSMLCCSLPCRRREWRELRHNWTSLIGRINYLHDFTRVDLYSHQILFAIHYSCSTGALTQPTCPEWAQQGWGPGQHLLHSVSLGRINLEDNLQSCLGSGEENTKLWNGKHQEQINPLDAKFFGRNKKHIFTLYVIPPH